MRRKKLLFTIALVLMFVLIPALVASASIVAGAKYEIQNLGGTGADTVYRLILSAKSPNEISYFHAVLSFDSAVIQPVTSTTPRTNVATANNDAFTTAFKPLAYSVANKQFLPVGEGWQTDAGRVAFSYGVVATEIIGGAVPEAPLSHVVSNGAYKPMFAFYFKVKPGQQVTSSTFRFESGSGSLLPKYNTQGYTAGVRINSRNTLAGNGIHTMGSITPTSDSGSVANDTTFAGTMPKRGDVNGDGYVNPTDLTMLLENFGK